MLRVGRRLRRTADLARAEEPSRRNAVRGAAIARATRGISQRSTPSPTTPVPGGSPSPGPTRSLTRVPAGPARTDRAASRRSCALARLASPRLDLGGRGPEVQEAEAEEEAPEEGRLEERARPLGGPADDAHRPVAAPGRERQERAGLERVEDEESPEKPATGSCHPGIVEGGLRRRRGAPVRPAARPGAREPARKRARSGGGAELRRGARRGRRDAVPRRCAAPTPAPRGLARALDHAGLRRAPSRVVVAGRPVRFDAPWDRGGGGRGRRAPAFVANARRWCPESRAKAQPPCERALA